MSTGIFNNCKVLEMEGYLRYVLTIADLPERFLLGNFREGSVGLREIFVQENGYKSLENCQRMQGWRK